jgi:hypothetical protein
MTPFNFARSLLGLAAVALAGAAQGACEVPTSLRSAPPIINGKPVVATATFTLVDVIAIKDADQTFTLVALLVALRGRLPPVPYLTRMDELILFSTALVFAALAQAVLTSRLAQKEKLALAQRIDAYGRWIYLASFGVVLYVSLVRY